MIANQILSLCHKDGRSAIVIASSHNEAYCLAESHEPDGGWQDTEIAREARLREYRPSMVLALEKRPVEKIYLASKSASMEGLLVGFATSLNELHNLVQNDYVAKTGYTDVGTRLDLDNKMIGVWHTPSSETTYYYFSFPRVV